MHVNPIAIAAFEVGLKRQLMLDVQVSMEGYCSTDAMGFLVPRETDPHYHEHYYCHGRRHLSIRSHGQVRVRGLQSDATTRRSCQMEHVDRS